MIFRQKEIEGLFVDGHALSEDEAPELYGLKQKQKQISDRDTVLQIIRSMGNQPSAEEGKGGKDTGKFEDDTYVLDPLQKVAIDSKDPGSKRSMLFLVEDDIDEMNRYRINFYTLTQNHEANASKKDFLEFVKKFYSTDQNAISEFEKTYNMTEAGDKRVAQTNQWLEKQTFLLESTQSLLKVSTNPKVVGYLRLAFKDLYEGILASYKKKPRKTQQIYLVITPTEKELKKLKEKENFILFTSFLKGYTKENAANKAKKENKKSILVRVSVKPMTNKIKEHLDFGYWIHPDKEKENGANVVFNIYNVFKIEDFNEGEREMDVEYGSLAFIAEKRQKCRENGERLSEGEDRLIRNYDYLENVVQSIKSQTTVLQMSGYFIESVNICKSKKEQIRKTNPTPKVMDQQTLEMGIVYMMNKDYGLAEAEFNSIKDQEVSLHALVYKAELYLKNRQQSKLEKVVYDIEKNLSKYPKDSEISLKAQNFIGLELMNQGKFKQASKLYKDLIKSASRCYGFKHEGIPLVHDIYRNFAACETKLTNYKEALSLLDSTKSWQKVCEGSRSPNLIVTENLIRSVHMSRGSEIEVKKSQGQIKKLRSTISSEQGIFLSRSTPLIHLNESSFHVDTTPMALDQSSVNINL